MLKNSYARHLAEHNNVITDIQSYTGGAEVQNFRILKSRGP
jgi:hypothetical protein